MQKIGDENKLRFIYFRPSPFLVLFNILSYWLFSIYCVQIDPFPV